MANKGDTYTIELKNTHLNWGTYRRTHSRTPIKNEVYIPIPAKYARSYKIYNSNNSDIGLGYNIFNCTSSDGYFKGTLKAGGCSKKGIIYAKQFHGFGNLTALSGWFKYISANVGDKIKVEWISTTDVIISKV